MKKCEYSFFNTTIMPELIHNLVLIKRGLFQEEYEK